MNRWDGDQVTQLTGEPALYLWMTDLAATLMIWTWPTSDLTASSLSSVSTSGQFSSVSSVVSVREVQRVEAGLVRDVAAVELVQPTGQDSDTLTLPAVPQPDTPILAHGDDVLAPVDDGGVRDGLGVLCQCHRTVSGAGGPDLDPYVRPGGEDDEALLSMQFR